MDASGNIYTTGGFSTTTDFDPDTSSYNVSSNGDLDVFVHKLDNNGNFQWVKTYGSQYGDRSTDIEVDEQGTVFVTGHFNLTVDFDPGTQTANKTSNGNRDIFIQCLDSNGNLLWVETFGDIGSDTGTDLDLDDFNNLIVTGTFKGIIDFNPDTVGVFNLNSGSTSLDRMFLLHLDVYGNFHWALTNGILGTLAEPDNLGNIYWAGSYGIVSKYDSSGSEIWQRDIGNTENTSLLVNDQMEVFIAGVFYGTSDAHPGISTEFLTSTGASDMFIEKLDADGDFLWVESIPSSAPFSIAEIFVDDLENIYATGSFYDSIDLAPGSSELIMNFTNDHHGFVAKYSQCYSVTVDSHAYCDTLNWIDGLTYTSANQSSTVTLSDVNGCDSIIQLNFDLLSDSIYQEVVACDSFTWINGSTYYSTLSDTIVFTNLSGCDSSIYLDLTVNYSSSIIDSVVACDSLTWVNGETYYTSNFSATDTLTKTNGCV